MADLLLRDARVWGRDTVADIAVRDGRIADIGPDLPAEGGVTVERLDGAVVIPGLVDAHAHLDKTLWSGPWVPHTARPGIANKIRHGRERRPELGIPSVEYITALLRNMVALGTTHVRSHVDVDTGLELRAVDAVREAVAALDGRIECELVAFPQAGLLTDPGTEELLDRALAAGVEFIGGIDPAGLERDPVRHLDIVFGLAERHGTGVDIHLHDAGTLGAWQFELIIARTRAAGLAGRVTISHGYALRDVDPARQDALIAELADAGVAMASTAPSVPLPLAKLRAAGVPMGLGNDGVRDLWSPYGDGDMLERAMFQAVHSGYNRDEEITTALEAATYGGARLMGLSGYGLAVGDHADLVVLPVRNPAEAVVLRPTRSLVVKKGRVVARNGAIVE